MLPRQLLLHRGGVRVDLLGQRVVVRVGARLVGAVVRIAGEVQRESDRGFDRVGVQRPELTRRADALGFDRLDLVLGLARTDEDADAALDAPSSRVSDQVADDARLEVVLLRLCSSGVVFGSITPVSMLNLTMRLSASRSGV